MTEPSPFRPSVRRRCPRRRQGAQQVVHAFVGHDLPESNRELLLAGRITALLHHDLRSDLRQAAHAVMAYHGAISGPRRPRPSPIQIVTPPNLAGIA